MSEEGVNEVTRPGQGSHGRRHLWWAWDRCSQSSLSGCWSPERGMKVWAPGIPGCWGRQARGTEAHPRKPNSQAAGLLLQERVSLLSRGIFKEKRASSPGPPGCQARWQNCTGSPCCAGVPSPPTHLSPRGSGPVALNLQRPLPALRAPTFLLHPPPGPSGRGAAGCGNETTTPGLPAPGSPEQERLLRRPGPRTCWCSSACAHGWEILPGGQSGALTVPLAPKMGGSPSYPGPPRVTLPH